MTIKLQRRTVLSVASLAVAAAMTVTLDPPAGAEPDNSSSTDLPLRPFALGIRYGAIAYAPNELSDGGNPFQILTSPDRPWVEFVTRALATDVGQRRLLQRDAWRAHRLLGSGLRPRDPWSQPWA